MNGWLIASLSGVGTLFAGGLFRLAYVLGKLAETIKQIDRRVERIERREDGRKRAF